LPCDCIDELVACAGEESRRNRVAVWWLDRGERAWATDHIPPTQGRDRLAWSGDGERLAIAFLARDRGSGGRKEDRWIRAYERELGGLEIWRLST
jgi:hypothetical protein